MNDRKKQAMELLKKVEPRNYWNTSGKDREFMRAVDDPDPDCIPRRDARGRIYREPANPWWIDSKEHGYCFWRWIQERSTPDGKMEPLQQHEIARLMGCSSTKIHFIIKQAIAKIKAQGTDEILKEFLGSEAEDEDIVPDSSLYSEDPEN